MRLIVMSVCCLVLFLAALTSAVPVAQLAEAKEPVPIELLQEKDTLKLGDAKLEENTRGKRTIGFLRETFPTISEIIDRILQTITRFMFRVIGRLVLGNGGGGGETGATATDSRSGAGASSSSSGGSGRRISITLPTYAPSLDDEDEDEEEEDSSPAASSNDVLASASSNKEAVSTQDTSQNSETKSRVARAVDNQAEISAAALDQDVAANDENRDKRFLFSNEGGGSAGGSGNFLFDIIRLIAGSGTTEEAVDAEHGTTGSAVGVGYSAGAAAIETPELDAKPDDGYTSGIPGPITRLFVIANRGISNLIQDLILRLAQTSERVVNFKARLITSII